MVAINAAAEEELVHLPNDLPRCCCFRGMLLTPLGVVEMSLIYLFGCIHAYRVYKEV